ncbi:MAG: hypothetical protein ACYSVY_12710 [Planctomycetota bacterium]|jgi:hypothetical protein
MNFEYLTIRTATGECDIDISEAVYTGFIDILTITPAAGESLDDVTVDFDLNKATTGYHAVATGADTIDFAVLSKIDGTNWRGIQNGTQVIAGSPASEDDGQRFKIGAIPAGGAVKIQVKLNAERGDTEIPYRVTYKGPAPTITAVAAA